MVGNVWEWPATANSPGRYELRGSAFTSPLFRGAPAIPNDANENMHDDDTGFRCVATPETTPVTVERHRTSDGADTAPDQLI
ncbi:hypothetical protein ACFWFZ_30095 [Streptomyces sp. NPDC060232]|uniref:hypothetical protein n=1 Tax=Streptomyces sp. NPDC060232 TaxID=3347079 RepID=UPI0036462E71